MPQIYLDKIQCFLVCKQNRMSLNIPNVWPFVRIATNHRCYQISAGQILTKGNHSQIYSKIKLDLKNVSVVNCEVTGTRDQNIF